MPLAFKTSDFKFTNSEGADSKTQTVSFPHHVNLAETAVQSFQFDFVEADRNIDKVQVSAFRLGINGNNVDVEVRVNYADRLHDDEYNATVRVLVIADMQ
jgi:flagellar basal body rod protein FlgB